MSAPAPDATARAFDPTKPFCTRDGREVANFEKSGGNRVWPYEGLIDGRRRFWRTDGRASLYSEDDLAHLDLVNVDPAPDATAPGADAIDELLKTVSKMPWRLGRHYNIHVYEFDRPIATFHDTRDACEAIAARNAIPLLPAYIARREAEARRKALERALKTVAIYRDMWAKDVAETGDPGERRYNMMLAAERIENGIRALIDKDPTS